MAKHIRTTRHEHRRTTYTYLWTQENKPCISEINNTSHDHLLAQITLPCCHLRVSLIPVSYIYIAASTRMPAFFLTLSPISAKHYSTSQQLSHHSCFIPFSSYIASIFLHQLTHTQRVSSSSWVRQLTRGRLPTAGQV